MPDFLSEAECCRQSTAKQLIGQAFLASRRQSMPRFKLLQDLSEDHVLDLLRRKRCCFTKQVLVRSVYG